MKKPFNVHPKSFCECQKFKFVSFSTNCCFNPKSQPSAVGFNGKKYFNQNLEKIFQHKKVVFHRRLVSMVSKEYKTDNLQTIFAQSFFSVAESKGAKNKKLKKEFLRVDILQKLKFKL